MTNKILDRALRGSSPSSRALAAVELRPDVARPRSGRSARGPAASLRALRMRITGAGHREDGFTLIEVLFVAVLAAAVIAAPLDFIVQSLKQQNVSSSRAYAERQGQSGLQVLVRDLRQAVYQNATSTPSTVTLSSTSTTQTIAFSLPTVGNDTTPRAVTWTCTNNGNCTRTVGAGHAYVEIAGIQSASFTGYDSTGAVQANNPSSVAVTLNLSVISQLDSGGTHTVTGVSNPIVLQTTIDLRNFA